MKAFYRSRKAPLRWWAQRFRNFSVPKDVTGSIIRTSASAVIMESWDESIMNILSSNQDSRPKLTEILNSDANFHFAKVLHAFEDVRYQLYPGDSTNKTFLELEALLSEGKPSGQHTALLTTNKNNTFSCLICRQIVSERRILRSSRAGVA